MRKFVILIFIIGFIGSASAAEVTYNFTAGIQTYVDDSGIFSELGYSNGMPLNGTITINTETAPLITPYGGQYDIGAVRYYDTGIIQFENQNYDWLPSSSPTLLVVNKSETYRETTITTIHNISSTPEIIPGVTYVEQKITLRNLGLDASMPENLEVGFAAEYFVKITRGGISSWFLATVDDITNADAAAVSTTNQTEEPAVDIDSLCPCEDDWKNHGQYVSCVAKETKELVAAGQISEKERTDMVKKAAKSTCGENKKRNKRNKNGE